MEAKQLNERNIQTIQPGEVLRDKLVRGLQLRAFTNSKSFYLSYTSKAGVQRKPKLGELGQITTPQARQIAQDMLAQVAMGQDPSRLRAIARGEPSVADLWDEYWAQRGSKKKSGASDAYNYKRFIAPRFATHKLSHVRYEDVAGMVEALSATPTQANRVLALASTLFGYAIKPLRWAADNPCLGVARNKETKRRRYMAGEETARIAQALDKRAATDPASVAFIYLLILTGARKGEIAAAKWEWIKGNTIALPDSKTGAKTIHLPPAAMDVLDKLPRTSGTLTGIKDPKKLWGSVRAEAGCPDLRLHDLRHSFASAALSAGLSLAQIGELLGHRHAQTTMRYAHLVEDAAQAAVAVAADHIMSRLVVYRKPSGDEHPTQQDDPHQPVDGLLSCAGFDVP